jgi:hypothetical protein
LIGPSVKQGSSCLLDTLRAGTPRFRCKSDYAAQVSLASREVDGFWEKKTWTSR